MSTPFDSSDEETPREAGSEEILFDPKIATTEEIATDPTIHEAEVVEESPTLEGGVESPLLPPEAQGEANGGPLGCCLGTVSGLFLTVLVITLISIAVTNQRYLSPGWVMVPAALLGAIVGGWIGWRVGKSIYREYELSPERRERLERIDQQWQSRRNKTGRVRRAKMGKTG